MIKLLKGFLAKDDSLTMRDFVAQQIMKNKQTQHIIMRIIAGFEISMLVYGFFVFNHANPRYPLYMSLYASLAFVSLLGDAILSYVEKKNDMQLVHKVIGYGYFYFLFIVVWSMIITTFDVLNGGTFWVGATVTMAISVFLTLNPIYNGAVIVLACGYMCYLMYLKEGQFSNGMVNILIFALIDCAVIFRNYKFLYNDLYMEKKLTELSMRDALTALNNRRALKKRIDEKAFDGVKSVAMIDIDNFKNINDTLGHQVGDEALLKISTHLRDSFKDTEIFRYGGDEFVIFSEESCGDTLDKLRRLNRRLTNVNLDLPLHISGGITSVGFNSDMETALKTADDTLYEVKRNGKGKFMISKPQE